MINLRKEEQWSDHMTRIFPEWRNMKNEDGQRILARTVTFQVTDRCNLCCTYCYQINKGTRRLSFETAKKMIDDLLEDKTDYCNQYNSPGIIIEFIGGEPFLEVELMDQIVEYFKKRSIELMHPWAEKYMISISSNGTLYFQPEVQKFMKKNRRHLSISITIDGNKELHDKCRVFPDGSGSYDLAYAAAQDWMAQGGYMGSKITICPENLPYLNEAISYFINTGYDIIHANTVYEEGWTKEDATRFYWQLKELADYLMDNNLQNDIYISLFEQDNFEPMEESDNQNWCWAKGTPILTNNGYVPIEDLQVGDVVYTHDGSLKPIVRTTHHFADNCVRIKASGGYDLVCTDNHKLFVKELDHIGFKGVRHYNNEDKVKVRDIKHKDLIQLFSLNGNVHYDTNLAYLVGRYIGDGWDYREGNGHAICCSFAETKDLLNKFQAAYVNVHLNENKTVNQLCISTRYLDINNAELHRICSQCGHLANNKHIPAECFEWDVESLKALVQGYVDADGYINKKGQYKCGTVSKRLADELMIILRTIGYAPTCAITHRAGKSKILGRDVNIQDRYEVYWYSDSDKAKYVHQLDGKWWTYGLTTEKAEDQEVYNITVAENHSYVAGGLVSSNCGGTGMMLAIDPDGYYYPCIRYMESSLGTDQPPIRIGHVDTGIACTAEDKATLKCLDCITRRSQSTDECFYCPIAKGCAWCFPAGTMINTPNGLQAIETLNESDEVLDQFGDVQVVEKTMSHEADNLVRVKAAGIDVITTSEHPFLTKRVVKRNHNIPTYGEPEWIEAGRLKKSDRIGLFTPQAGQIDVSKEFAYIVGRYVGDGWKTASKRLKHPYRFYICTAFDETEDFINVLNKANVKFSTYKNRTADEININISKQDYLYEVLDDAGRYAHNKKVPRAVWNWNEECIKSFLNGYFDADGSYDEEKELQRFTSVSKELILDVAELIRIAYHKNVNICKYNRNGLNVIEGITVQVHDVYEGSFLMREPKKKYYEYDDLNHIMWVNVATSKEDVPASELVYNLTVANTHSYIANGAIVHNCSGYNYQKFGTPNKRATYICDMHKARALANVYYWNKQGKYKELHCPKEWALEIIPEEEYNMLEELANDCKNRNNRDSC